MIHKEQIEKLALECIENFEHKEDIFIVDIHVSLSNSIQVFVDSDKSIDISDCIKISRHIESNLDREKEDFELNVSSYGLDQSLKMIRQFKKYIDRDIRFVLKNNEDFKATLISIEDETLHLFIKPKKKKELGIEKTVQLSEIQKAKLIITF
jgi:ribosome maturation factor RimP